MKKLMIAAVAAASAGLSFAADCGCEDPCSTDCVYAYEVILLAKTTSGKPVTVMPKVTPCGCEEVAPCSSSCYRKPLMRKFAGFVFGDAKADAVECEGQTLGDGICGSACGCIDFSGDSMQQVFWDVKTKKIVEGAKLTFDKIDAIGYQSRETVEAYGSFEFVENEIDGKVTLAGFGKRGKRANGTIMLKNLSGFFAGYYPCLCTDCPVTVCGDPEPCVSTIATPWNLCCDTEIADDDGHTAAYGKWTLKWNETARQRLTKNYSAAALTKNGYQPPSTEE